MPFVGEAKKIAKIFREFNLKPIVDLKIGKTVTAWIETPKREFEIGVDLREQEVFLNTETAPYRIKVLKHKKYKNLSEIRKHIKSYIEYAHRYGD
jgi:hypothetical protein